MSLATPRTATIATAIAATLRAIVVSIGDPFLIIFTSPTVAGFASVGIVTALAWLFGPALRATIHGRGRQAVWGFCGHEIRGEFDDDGTPWISVADCQSAGEIELLEHLPWVPERHKRRHRDKGWLLCQPGMRRLLEVTKSDEFAVTKFRLFLDREVWQTRRG